MKHIRSVMATFAVPLALAAGIMAAPAFAQGAGQQAPEDLSLGTDGILITLDQQTSRSLDAVNAADQPTLLAASPVVQDLADEGITVDDAFTTDDGTVVLTADAVDDAQALKDAQNVDGVAAVQYNFVYHLIDSVEADVASVSLQSALQQDAALPVDDPFTQQSDPTQSPNQYWAYSTGLIDAWREVESDHTVTIAVLDSGADLSHPDLEDNILTDLAYDVTDDTPLADCEIQDADARGHGTSVTGIAAATSNNAIGLSGASNNASVLPVKVVKDNGTITSQNLIKAFDYLFGLIEDGELDNLRVINMSLGGYDNSGLGTDQAFHSAIQTALYDYGILSVCSGGNGNSVNTPYTAHNYPSDFEECIAVTALETDGTNLVWSDYNLAKDISAPGENIWSTNTMTSSAGRYYAASGTSEASPIVAGSVALLYAACPSATPDQVREALYETASPINDPVYDRTSTSGSHGALQVDDALAYLQNLTGETTDPDPDQNPDEGQGDETVELPFTDVAEDAWYYGAVSYAYENKIMNDFEGTTLFGPLNPITREQAACVLYNMFGNNEIAEPCGLPDVKDDYYTNAVNWAVAHGYINGFYNEATGTYTSFGVGQTLTREQLASIVANVAQKLKGANISDASSEKYGSMPDCAQTSPWAVANMIWATDKGIINGVANEGTGVRFLAPQQVTSRAEVAAVMMNCLEEGIL